MTLIFCFAYQFLRMDLVMKIIITGLTILATLTAALFFPGSTSQMVIGSSDFSTHSQTVAPKYALLVGVNKYKAHPDIKNLNGTHNDVALMKSLLAEYGFKEELKPATPAAPCGDQTVVSAVKTLCSEQATKDAILNAFDNHLIKNAKDYWKKGKPEPANGPAVVFYYSGHGSQVADKIALPGEKESELVKDEADDLDETIVPHDSDSQGLRDIRDDSFETRMRELRQFTTNITFMSDSCHSGTITRGGGMKGFKRNIPTASGTRGGGNSTDNMFADNSYVTISGSLPTQFSFERDLPDPATQKVQLNGLLTYHFVHQLRQNPGATYREIVGLIRNAVTAAGENQTPQVEGDVDRPVFGSSGSRGKRAIAIKCKNLDLGAVCSEEIKKSDADGTQYTVRKIEMDVGQIVGARVGGPVVLYSPKAKELTGDVDKIASGTITYADSFRSEAEVTLTDPKAADLPPLAKAVLMSPSFRDSKRIVAVDLSAGSSPSDAGTASMQKLAAAMKDSPFLAPVEETGLLSKLNPDRNAARSAGDWEIAVVRGTYADFKVGREKAAVSKNVTPPDAQNGYFITNRSGGALYDLWIPANSPDAATRIQDVLESHVKAENVRSMMNEASKLKDKVTVEMVRHKGIRQAGSGCEVIPFTPEEEKGMVAGAPRLKTSEAFHVNVTNNSFKPLMIYIFAVDSAGAVSLLYPAAGARETLKPGVTLVTNASDACQTYAFDTTAPMGAETIKVIASESEIQADLLLQPGIKNSRSGADSPLEKLLRQAGGNTRGPRPFQGPVADWWAYNLEYTVVP